MTEPITLQKLQATLQQLLDRLHEYPGPLPSRKKPPLIALDTLRHSWNSKSSVPSKEELERIYDRFRTQALKIKDKNRGFKKLPAQVGDPIVNIQNLLEWCIEQRPKRLQDEDNLDDLDNKIIELYQLAEQENTRPPGGGKIAETAYKNHITKRKFTAESINKRIRKLRKAGLIDQKPMKEMTNYIEPGALREESDN